MRKCGRARGLLQSSQAVQWQRHVEIGMLAQLKESWGMLRAGPGTVFRARTEIARPAKVDSWPVLLHRFAAILGSGRNRRVRTKKLHAADNITGFFPACERKIPLSP